MAFNTTPDAEDWDYFYFTNYSPPIRTMESPVEILPYQIITFADISSTRITHRCIGRTGNGNLANPCKAALSHNTRPTFEPISRGIREERDGWKQAETLFKLARSCLCEECCQTQLSDVVVAWVNEIEDRVGKTVRRADYVVDLEEMDIMSRVADIAPVKTLVAASVATREVFSKVFSFWS
jgi:hypothetical protein